MLALKDWQNEAIIDLLQASDFTNEKQLHSDIMKEGKVDAPTAQSYIMSWKHNRKEGAIGVILTAVNKKRSQEKNAIPPHPTLGPAIRTTVVNGKVKRDMSESTLKKLPEDGDGIVAAILKLHMSGLSHQQIIEAGYNRNTVYRQIGEYKKRKKQLALA